MARLPSGFGLWLCLYEHLLRCCWPDPSSTLPGRLSGSSTAGLSGPRSDWGGRRDLDGDSVSDLRVSCKALGHSLLSLSLRVHRGVEVWNVETEGRT